MTFASRLRSATRAVGRMSWSDRVEVVKILAVLVVVEVWVRVGRLPSLVRFLGISLQLGAVPMGSPMLTPLPPEARHRLELTRDVMAHVYPGPACLRTSLVAGNRLRHFGPRLRVGVTRGKSKLAAHAWLEIGGQYFDAGAAGYEPTESLDA